MPKDTQPRHLLLSDTAILVYIALARLAVHLLTNGGYGYARDELYYIACGNHLDWGYVDHPPMTPFLARLVTSVAGTSLAAIRFLPAVAAAAITFVAGRIARELGGKLFAQVLTAVAVSIGYSSLAFGTVLTTNVFDQFFWAAALYLFTVILVRGDARHWIWLGVVLGLGLMNKHPVAFLGGAMFVGLVLSDERKHLGTRWPWYAAGAALLVFLPNIVWEVGHGWPTLEFLKRAEINRMPRVAPWGFFLGQVFSLHLLLLPVWLIGLWRALAGKEEKKLRPVGLAYLALFVYFLLSRAKSYYLIPFYPPLLALGWVAVERWIAARKLRWAPAVVVVVLLAGGAVTAPLALPVLEPEALIRVRARDRPEPPQPAVGGVADAGRVPGHVRLGGDGRVRGRGLQRPPARGARRRLDIGQQLRSGRGDRLLRARSTASRRPSRLTTATGTGGHATTRGRCSSPWGSAPRRSSAHSSRSSWPPSSNIPTSSGTRPTSPSTSGGTC